MDVNHVLMSQTTTWLGMCPTTLNDLQVKKIVKLSVIDFNFSVSSLSDTSLVCH